MPGQIIPQKPHYYHNCFPFQKKDITFTFSAAFFVVLQLSLFCFNQVLLNFYSASPATTNHYLRWGTRPRRFSPECITISQNSAAGSNWEREWRYPRPATSWWQGEEWGRSTTRQVEPGGVEEWGGIENFSSSKPGGIENFQFYKQHLIWLPADSFSETNTGSW